MKIGEYIKKYTLGKRIRFIDFVNEIKEFLAEIVKFNIEGIKEEFGDVFHFLQLWLYWRIGLNNEIWLLSKSSVDKFIARRKVWEKLYAFVGLDKDVSKYCGNYKREEKVISHLGSFGISKDKAIKAFNKIVVST